MPASDFERVYHSSPVPSVVVQDGFIRLVNRQMVQFIGYTEEELLRIPVAELVHPDDRGQVINSALHRLSGKKSPDSYEFRFINRQKKDIYVKGFFCLTEYNTRPAIFCQLFDITKQKQAEASEMKYRKILSAANTAVLVTQGGMAKYINPSFIEVTGYAKEELDSKPLLELIHPDDRRIFMDRQDKLTKGARVPHIHSLRIITKAGIVKWLEVNSALFSWVGKPATLSFINDITDRKRAEEELTFQKGYFQQLFENSPEGIVILDVKNRIIDINRGFTRLFQYHEDEIKGRCLNDVIAPEDLAAEALRISSIVHGGESIQIESVRKRKDGSLVDVSILGIPIVIEGVQVGIYAIYSDISGRKRAEEQQKYLSLHDPVTGLYNRNCFEQEMSRLEGGSRTSAGIILCDVDGLKLVNDTLGHSTGDTLLRAAAETIKKSFAEDDLIARMGGDEFAILIPGCSKGIMEDAVFRIRQEVAGYNQKNPDLPLSMSIGFAIGSETAALDDIFKEADNNMYREKLHRGQSVRSNIVQTLMKALEARDFITEGHAQRLQDLVVVMGQAIGLPESRISDLRLLAKFHDIGKVGIPDHILFKPGPLTPDETSEMQKHCEIGHRIAQSARDLIHISDWILKHHEWWNGQGYPLMLKEKGIPIECRILAIADAYDAMTSDRPYRKALSHSQAVAELKRCAGIQFDPEMVSIFIEKFVRHSDKLEKLVLERTFELRKTRGQLQLEISGRRQLESNMNHFFMLSDDIFLVVDFAGHVKFTNNAFEKILGHVKEGILSKNIADFIHPDDLNRHAEEKLKLISGGPPTVNHAERYLCADGSYRWLEWNAVPVLPEGLIYAVARDITGRIKMEEGLRKSNRQTSKILESIQDAFFSLDNQWRFTYINRAAQNLLNVNAKKFIGKSVWEVWPEDIDRKIYMEFHKAMREQAPVHFEEQSVRTGRWFEVHAYPSQDGLSVYSSSITERKQMEKKLKLNEARLKALLKLSQMTEAKLEEVYDFVQKEGVRLTESDVGFLGFISEDETTLNTYSWSTDVLNKCNIFERPVVAPVETSGLWGEAVRNRRHIIVNDYAAPNSRKKGYPKEHIPLSRVMVVPVFEGGRIVMLSGVANKKEDYNDSDVNQLTLLMNEAWKIIRRRQVEEELSSSEERFYKSFHASPNIMTIVSFQNNRFIDVNQCFVKTFGYSREEVIGRTAMELHLINASDRQRMMKEFKRQDNLHNYEYMAKTRSGEERTLLVSVEVITLNNEKCLLFASHDITEYKQLEKEMARLDRLNLIGEMAAGIGHEIRNPMTTVRGFLQLLRGREELCHQKDYFNLMIDELDRANAIITEFLSLAKNKSVKLEKKNINNIINSLFPLIQADAMENDIHVQLELSDIPDSYLDEKEIRQLVLNLFRNGLEAMPQGKTLTIKTFVDGANAVLAIQDEGRGIPADVLERLGTPFLSTKENGTGLGLAVCYSIAARHEANIEVKTSSAGTTFFVRFKIS